MKRVLAEIYEAVDDDQALARLATNVATLCGARSANIVCAAPEASPFQQFSYFPAEYVPLYLQHFADKDPWRKQAEELGIKGRPIAMDERLPPEQFVQTEMYNELLKPIGDDTARCMGIDGSSRGAYLHIAVHRPISGPALALEKKTAFRRLSPTLAT